MQVPPIYLNNKKTVCERGEWACEDIRESKGIFESIFCTDEPPT